jgi:hypothetical protein
MIKGNGFAVLIGLLLFYVDVFGGIAYSAKTDPFGHEPTVGAGVGIVGTSGLMAPFTASSSGLSATNRREPSRCSAMSGRCHHCRGEIVDCDDRACNHLSR